MCGPRASISPHLPPPYWSLCCPQSSKALLACRSQKVWCREVAYAPVNSNAEEEPFSLFLSVSLHLCLSSSLPPSLALPLWGCFSPKLQNCPLTKNVHLLLGGLFFFIRGQLPLRKDLRTMGCCHMVVTLFWALRNLEQVPVFISAFAAGIASSQSCQDGQRLSLEQWHAWKYYVAFGNQKNKIKNTHFTGESLLFF